MIFSFAKLISNFKNDNFVVRNFATEDRKICDVCQRLLFNVGDNVTGSRKSRHNDEDGDVMNDVSDDSSSDVNRSISSENSNVGSSTKSVNVKKTAILLNKIKALKLPVTVSLTDKPKRDVKLIKSNEISEDETVPAKKPAPRFATTKNDSDVIEMAGRTVTNRCSWCGEVFHRLYLFMDHLKVILRVSNF